MLDFSFYSLFIYIYIYNVCWEVGPHRSLAHLTHLTHLTQVGQVGQVGHVGRQADQVVQVAQVDNKWAKCCKWATVGAAVGAGGHCW